MSYRSTVDAGAVVFDELPLPQPFLSVEVSELAGNFDRGSQIMRRGRLVYFTCFISDTQQSMIAAAPQRSLQHYGAQPDAT